MNNRDNLLNMLKGRPTESIPLIFCGFLDEKTTHKFAPPECYDENTYYIPSDDPLRDVFSPELRTAESRKAAVNLGHYLDCATMGVGKGGLLPFAHGGPGEIQPKVIERGENYKILEYEGGHWRRIHYRPHSIHYYNFPVTTAADLEKLVLPDMLDPARFRDVEEDCRTLKEAGLVPTGSIQGFFSGIHNSFMAFEDTLVNLMLEPDFMRDVTARLARMSLDAARMMLDRGVEIIDVADDLGNAAGLLISPTLFRDYFLPWYEELVSLVHGKGGFVHMHSHGNIAPILPDLIQIGIDIMNPFDWDENPDLPDLVRRYGDKLIFCGGLTGALYQFDSEEVKRMIHRACALSEIAERGYIFMYSSGPEDLPLSEWELWQRIIRNARRARYPV
jgi:hypothetical protein